MIESIYSSQNLRDEILKSPFAPFIKTFATEHFNEGYSILAIKTKLTIIVKFIRWSAYNSITPSKLKKIHISKFKSEKVSSTKSGSLLGFSRFLALIEIQFDRSLIDKKLNRFKGGKRIQKEVDKFELYMRNERGLTPTSIVRFKVTISQFLTFVFQDKNLNLRKIEAADILNFLKERGKHYKDRTLRCDGSALKCYMRRLYGKGITKTDLSHAVPQFSIWRNQNVIHTISEKEMLQMLNSCDLNRPIGIRDYSILLLLMRYGFRPIELINLRFGDVCFEQNKITVQGKGKSTVLPLEDDVKDALERYINYARPLSKDKEIFIRSKAPFVSFKKSGAISSIVRHALNRCDLKPEISGARLLRYSVASNILNKGGSLQEVSELLRHTSINTSVRYTRLDMNRLKLVPLSWPTSWRKEL